MFGGGERASSLVFVSFECSTKKIVLITCNGSGQNIEISHSYGLYIFVFFALLIFTI